MPRPPRTNHPPRTYSTAHVARRFGISIPTVQRWVDAGQLKAWKTPGGHRRIDAASADALFESRAIQAASGGSEAELAAPSVTVILVEDNPNDRDLLSAMIGTALPEARLSVFESPIPALVAIGQDVPDVLITDIVMPHMNGVEMLRQLAERCVVRPRMILAVSSMAPEQISKLGGLPPAVQFFQKPVNPDDFVAALHAAA